jgi:hypothetical protein
MLPGELILALYLIADHSPFWVPVPFVVYAAIRRRFSLRWLFALMTAEAIAFAIPLILVSALDEWPGGLRPSYVAIDGDERLTGEARTASPLIAALRQYHSEHGDYPADLTTLRPLLPNSAFASGQFVDGWHYFPASNSAGFSLSRKLGWETALLYHWDGADGSWVFARGDGSPDTPIVLNP